MGAWGLALAAAGFWSGILWATGGSGTLGPRASVLVLCAGCVVLCVGALARSRQGLTLPFVFVAVSFGLLGAGWAGMRDARVRASPIVALAGRSVTIVGTLGSSADQGMFGWTAAMRGESFRSNLESAPDVRPPGSIWLQGRGRPPDLPPGEQIVVRGRVRRLRGSFGAYLRRRGYAAMVEVDALEDAGPPRNFVVRLANSVRGSLRRSLTRIFPPKDAGLLMGLALGDTSTLDRRVEEDFRASGLSHLTAVSGQNLVMFLAPVLGLASLAGVGRKARFIVGLCAIGFFVLLTGAEPSVLRASAMSGLTLLGVFLGRPRSPPAILGGAVLLLLVHDPTLVHAVGFQLSVAATVGMAILAQPVADRLVALPRSLALAAGTTLAAQAGVMPVLLFYFQVFPIVSIPANLLAFPAVGPAMLLGLASGGLEMVWRPLGIAAAALARIPIGYLEWLSDRMARAPLPSITSPGGQVVTLVLGLASVCGAGWWIRSRRRMPRKVAVLAALLLPVLVLTSAFKAGPPSRLTVVFFDVGQGDAALIRSPAGANILIDGGPDPDLVAAKLASLGIRRLDLIIASHPHADHVAGLPTVLARFHVAAVIDSGCGGDSPYYVDFLRAVRSARVPFHHPRAGTVIRVGDVRLDVLGPRSCYRGTPSDANNDSLVLRLSDGRGSVLFPGDAEQPAQADLLHDQRARLAALVLKVPHQGGDTSLDRFFQEIHARVAVVSVGPNRYGHPVQSVLESLSASGMRVFRTDQAGDVAVSFDEGRVLVSSGG